MGKENHSIALPLKSNTQETAQCEFHEELVTASEMTACPS